MKRGSEFTVGWAIGSNGTSLALSTNSGNAVAVAFIAPAATVQAVRLPIVAVANGGIPAGDLRCRIVPSDANNSYLPDMSNVLATGYSQNAANSARMFANIANFSSHTLTPGTRYWLVFDNLNTTGTASVQPTDYTAQSNTNFAHAVATYSSGAWSYNGTARRLSEQIEFSNGDMLGAGLITSGISPPPGVYGSRMSGVRVTVGSIGFRVVGVVWYSYRNGSGCTVATRVLDLSNNVLATSHYLYGAQQSTSGAHRPFYFSTPVELQPNTTYRIVLASPPQDGDSTNWFGIGVGVRAHSSDAVATLHGGTFQSIQRSDYNGTSWTDDTNMNLFSAFRLVLDPDQPFITTSGAAGGIVPAINRGVW